MTGKFYDAIAMIFYRYSLIKIKLNETYNPICTFLCNDFTINKYIII